MDEAKVRSFWQWFTDNSQRLARFESDQVSLSNEIKRELRKLHQPDGYAGGGPCLSFDLQRRPDGVREFIISADGIESAFHLARELAASAPQLPKWQFRALIPPRDLENLVSECKLEPDDIWYKAHQDNGRANVTLYIRNLAPEAEHDPSEVRDFLLQVLGEETFGRHLGLFDCEALPHDPEKWGLKPLKELPAVFADLN